MIFYVLLKIVLKNSFKKHESNMIQIQRIRTILRKHKNYALYVFKIYSKKQEPNMSITSIIIPIHL